MQNVTTPCLMAITALLVSAGSARGQAEVEPVVAVEAEGVQTPDDGFASDRERASYAIGVDIGRSFKSQSIDIDVDVLGRALRAAYTGQALRQTQQQSEAALRKFQETLAQHQEEQAAQDGVANREVGAAFLAENGAREGVITTESGLQYEILAPGEGATAGETDTVELNYTGTLIDGEVFDSSADRGPARFPVEGVIPGFSEGLQLLPVGTKAKLYIPADLAYGDSPRGPGGPGSTLIFEVEMLGITAAPEEPSLEEQIQDAQTQMEDELRTIREESEEYIEELKAQLKAEAESGEGESATVGGEESGEAQKPPMYD